MNGIDPMSISCPDCYSQPGISCQDDFGSPCAGRVREALAAPTITGEDCPGAPELVTHS